MADDDTGDPQDYEFSVPLIVGGIILACCLLAIILGCIGQQCENSTSGGGTTDPCCGLGGCFTNCCTNLTSCFRGWCNCGSEAVGGASAEAANTTKRALSARDKDETNECCGGCDDGGCWNAVTCGIFRTGGAKKTRSGRRRNALMPEDVPEDVPEGAKENAADKVSVAQPVADLDAPYYYDNACAPLLALPTGAVIERGVGRV